MKRITIIGLAALCALALAAVGAGSASAAETTAYTCVSGQTGFSDADCSTAASPGTFGHVAITTDTQLTLKKVTNQVFKFTVGGATVTYEGTGPVECLECMVHNAGTAGAMEATGSGGRLRFNGVIVKNHEATCEVAGKMVTTKPVVFHTVATNEVKIEPVTPTVLGEFEIKEIAASCAFKGAYVLKGDLNGIANGAFLTINVPAASKTMTIGPFGVELTGKATMEAGVTNPANPSEHHPAALT